MQPLSEIETIAERYVVFTSQLIGQGAYSRVFRGMDIRTGTPCAIKIMTDVKTFYTEAQHYETLRGGEGVPTLKWAGLMKGYAVLVLDCLSATLGQLHRVHQDLFSIDIISAFAVQMLSRIRFLHSRSLVHADIKPDNFTFGRLGDPQQLVYILDFSHTFPYIVGGRHIRNIKPRPPRSCTLQYASLNWHKRAELSRRDDLESLAYVLLEFFLGRLPWDPHKGNSAAAPLPMCITAVQELKARITEQLDANVPQSVTALLRYSRALGFDEEPDYDLLQAMFTSPESTSS